MGQADGVADESMVNTTSIPRSRPSQHEEGRREGAQRRRGRRRGGRVGGGPFRLSRCAAAALGRPACCRARNRRARCGRGERRRRARAASPGPPGLLHGTTPPARHADAFASMSCRRAANSHGSSLSYAPPTARGSRANPCSSVARAGWGAARMDEREGDTGEERRRAQPRAGGEEKAREGIGGGETRTDWLGFHRRSLVLSHASLPLEQAKVRDAHELVSAPDLWTLCAARPTRHRLTQTAKK